MMQAAALLFAFLEIVVFTGCSAGMVHLLPQKAEKPRWMKGIFWVIYAALSVLLPNIGRDDVLTITVFTAVYLLAGWFLYHRSRIGLVYQLVYMVLMYAAEVIGIFLAIHLVGIFRLGNAVLSYLACVSKILLELGVMLAVRAILERRYMAEGARVRVGGMVIVPLFSLAHIFMYIIGGEVFFARYGYGWIILYCVLALAINLYCLYFWYDVALNRELKHKLKLAQQQNELTHQYYADLEENYSKSRKIIHDIRNHIHVLEQSGKVGHVQGYINDVYGMLDSLGLKFYSENRMLNIVLNDKLKGLLPGQLECNMGDVSLDFLSDLDVITVFANLLDNALEAGEGMEGFWVKLRGERIQDFTVVRVWNRCREGYVPGQSGKKGHEGLGLENVGQAVRKYHGEMHVECGDGVFTVTIMFPGP